MELERLREIDRELRNAGEQDTEEEDTQPFNPVSSLLNAIGSMITVVEDSPVESVVSSDEEQEREEQRQTAIQQDVASVIEGHRQI